MIQIEISGAPVPMNRPRMTKTGHVYSDQKVIMQQYQWQIRAQYRNEPLEGPLQIDIMFFMPIPKATSKKIHREMVTGTYYHICKPDCDNLTKFICDSMNGIVYADDAQVAEIKAKKVYAEKPGTLIRIHPLSLHQRHENDIRET